MRVFTAFVGLVGSGALGLGCAASPASAVRTAPHPILAEATPAPADSAAPAANKEQPDGSRVDRQINRAWGWVAVSVGAEAGVVAVITSFMMLHENSIRSADCTDKVCSADGLSANATMRNLEWWNAGAWAIAVGGAGVGTFLLLSNPSDKAAHTEVGIAPTGSGSGLLLKGSF